MSPSSRGRPFRLVPWDADFLRALKGELLAGRETRPGVAASFLTTGRAVI